MKTLAIEKEKSYVHLASSTIQDETTRDRENFILSHAYIDGEDSLASQIDFQCQQTFKRPPIAFRPNKLKRVQVEISKVIR